MLCDILVLFKCTSYCIIVYFCFDHYNPRCGAFTGDFDQKLIKKMLQRNYDFVAYYFVLDDVNNYLIRLCVLCLTEHLLHETRDMKVLLDMKLFTVA